MLTLTKEMVIATDYWLNKKKRSQIATELYDLVELGCVSLGKKIDIQDTERMRNSLDKHLSDPAVNVWRDQTASDERIFGFEELEVDIGELCSIGELLEIGSQYVGRRLKSWFMMANRVRYAEGNLGSGGGWHRDSAFTHQFKSICYLSDVELDNGPFEYVPYSHLTKAKLTVRDTIGLEQSRISDKDFQQSGLESRTFTGPAGTLLLADTRGIHRGRPNKAGARYAITTYFFEQDIPKQFRKLLQK